MAKDLAYLRAQTRTYLDEAVQADWSDAEVDREINNGYQEVVAAVIDVYEDFYVNTATFNTIAGQQEYGVSDGLPDNLFKVRRVEANYAPTTANTKLGLVAPITIDQVPYALGNNSNQGSAFHGPVYYLIGGGSTDYKIGLIPIPNQNGLGSLFDPNCKLWFVEEVDDLVLSTDVVKIPYPNRYAALISRYAAGVLLSKGQQEDKSGIAYLQLFTGGLLKMAQQLKERMNDGVRSVVDTAGDDVDFSNYEGF